MVSSAIFRIVDVLFTVFNFMILIRILCSWGSPSFRYKIVQFIAFCVDPYLNLFRRFIPPIGMIDISPIIAIVFLNVLEGFVFYIIR